MPSRSKKARVASLLPLLFFSLLRRGRTRRRAGSAKGKGRALGNAPGKAKAEKPLEESRRAHLRIAFGNARAPCREPRQSLRFGESLRGAGGSAPSHPFWRRGGLTATKQTASEKSPCAVGARGLFSLSSAPRSGLFAARDPSRRGRVFAPGAGAFVPPLSPPAGGRRRRRRGGTFTPRRGAPGQPRPGAGEGGARARPIVSQMGTIGQRRAPRYRLE